MEIMVTFRTKATLMARISAATEEPTDLTDPTPTDDS